MSETAEHTHTYVYMLVLDIYCNIYIWASPVVQLVKNTSAIWETWVQSLGWEDPPGEGKGYPLHSSILAWRIPWTVQSMRWQRVGHN